MAQQWFHFKLRGRWMVHVPWDQIDMAMESMKQGVEQELYTQLNSAYSDHSSPEYRKYLKFIPDAASCYADTWKYQAGFNLWREGNDYPLAEPADELFDRLGKRWLQVDQYDKALTAFTTGVALSSREGPWWPQILCARYNHLAYAHAMLGHEQEQFQALLKSAAFAVAAKNPADSRNSSNFPVFVLSFCNLAIRFKNCEPDLGTLMQFLRQDTLKAWEVYVADRSRTLQEKLASGIKQGVTSNEDLCFALADFLMHNDRDAYRTMLDILKSKFGSESDRQPFCIRTSLDLFRCMETSEILTLMKVIQLDTLNMALRAEQAIQYEAHWALALDILEVAMLEPPSEDRGWSLSLEVCRFETERAFHYFALSRKDKSTHSVASSSGEAGGSRGPSTPVPAEGESIQDRQFKSKELEALINRLESRTWDNLGDSSESLEFAIVGRDLAVWVMSPSAATISKLEDIEISLNTVKHMALMLKNHNQHRAAKSILQEVVSRFTDQPSHVLEELCMNILLEYVYICDVMEDFEETIRCCTKALKIAKDHGMTLQTFPFLLLLGSAYMNMRNITQAEKELRNARSTMDQSPELLKNDKLNSLLEGAEGILELHKCDFCGADRNLEMKHCKIAVSKLRSCVERLEKKMSSKDGDEYGDKYNWIMTSLRLSEALRRARVHEEANFTCNKALQAARREKSKFSLLAAEAAWTCGDIAAHMGNFVSAERYYREGLQEFDVHGFKQEYLAGRLNGGLGAALLMASRLPEAEAALRKAVNACSQVLMERNLTSQYRIDTFEKLKHFYNDLQFCLYSMYQQANESQKGIIAKEALIAAEQGRCRDLAFNLQERLRESRVSESESASIDDHNVGILDWRRFDTDAEYAWEHLKYCTTVCADAIKKQNAKVQRVTFVEYTFTNRHMLIWVLHSDGTQEPTSLQATTGLPSMFAVDIKEELINGLSTDELGPELEFCKWAFGSDSSHSQYDTVLQRAQASEAIYAFEVDRIEQLRLAPNPNSRQLIELYNRLIRPWYSAAEMVKEEPVIFIPHEGLSFVPFAALKPKDRAKYFIENHPIGISPSLRTLGWATNRYTTLRATSAVSPRNPMLFVADPFPVEKTPLEDAIKEVNAIATITGLPENSIATFSKEQATLVNVTSAMKSTAWFHIACHGEVSPDQYPQGVLFLSRTDDSSCGNDGYLTPKIIFNDVKWMTAHAVVLSACKVGQGKQTGEGLLGMSRAFMQAGVPLVIAPLRTVNSSLASAFMQSLYRRMVAGESVMDALRNTMLDVIKKRSQVLKPDGKPESWQMWDWAAWLAVGFPGVCLPI